MSHRVIRLHVQAPPKPPLGESCNGCGVCCASETCPVARVLLLQMRGPCRALEWREGRYVCGMLANPARYLRWLPKPWEGWMSRRVARRIAAGAGCDSDAQVELGPRPPPG